MEESELSPTPGAAFNTRSGFNAPKEHIGNAGNADAESSSCVNGPDANERGRGDQEGLTVLAVHALEAQLALADVLAEHVPSPRVARRNADAVVCARVGVARPCGWRWREAPDECLSPKSLQ